MSLLYAVSIRCVYRARDVRCSLLVLVLVLESVYNECYSHNYYSTESANRTTILDENVAAAAAAPSSFMRESIGMYDI